MDKHPRAPSEEARHLRVDLRLVDDGFAAANRGHGAEVFVVEVLEVLVAADQAHDVVEGDLSFLHGNRRNRRQRALRAVLEVCAVTDGKDVFAAFDLQLLVDDDATAAVNFAATVSDERHSLDAGCPDDGIRRDRGAIFELKILAIVIHDLRAQHDIDAFMAQDLDGMLAEVRRDHRQDVRRSLDELDADFAEVEMMEFFFLDLDELGESTGFLDARRAAANDDERQHAAAFFRILALVGTLEHVQHVVADVQGFLQRLHAVGIFLNALHAEEVRRGAGREDKIIVRDLAMVRLDDFAGLVNALCFRHEEFDVVVLAEERADRISDFVRGEDSRRYLIEQRLKQLEVVAVDDCDVYILLGKELCRLDAAKACTDDYDSWFLICHDDFLPKIPEREWCRVCESENMNFYVQKKGMIP